MDVSLNFEHESVWELKRNQFCALIREVDSSPFIHLEFWKYVLSPVINEIIISGLPNIQIPNSFPQYFQIFHYSSVKKRYVIFLYIIYHNSCYITLYHIISITNIISAKTLKEKLAVSQPISAVNSLFISK